MNWEIQLIRPLRTHRCGLPEVVRTLGDAIDLITGVPCRRILPSVNTNGAFRNMQSEALAARADGALQRHRELRMEFDMLRARADAERGLAHAWTAIGSSQQYGTLRERMAILMLAEAF